jgi:hypothetical protein
MFMPRIAILLLAEAIVFVVAALIHAGLLIEGFEHPETRVAESVTAAVLFLGFLVSWRRPSWTRIAGILTQGFALFGISISFFTIILGLGPQSLPDMAYHLAIIAVLIWGVIISTKTPGFPKVP